MAVASFEGYQPSPRFDLTKWTAVRISEGDAEVGPWTVIDEIALPDYPDATNPPLFNFTTTNATSATGKWFLVEFLDAQGNSEPTSPLFPAIAGVVPTAEDIRAESKIIFEEYGYGVPAPGDPDPLDHVVQESAMEFRGLTGIDLSSPTMLTDKRAPLIRKAIRMLTEYNAVRSTPEILETVADFDLLSSMSVGSYSETRRSISAMRQIKHPHPGINSLLGVITGMDASGNLVANSMVPVVGYDRHPPGEELMRPKNPYRDIFDEPPTLPRVLISGVI